MRYLIAVVVLVIVKSSVEGSIMIPIKGPLSRNYPALTMYRLEFKKEIGNEGDVEENSEPDKLSFQIYSIQEDTQVIASIDTQIKTSSHDKIESTSSMTEKLPISHNSTQQLETPISTTNTTSPISATKSATNKSTSVKPTVTSKVEPTYKTLRRVPNQSTHVSNEMGTQWSTSFSYSSSFTTTYSHTQFVQPTLFPPHRVFNPYYNVIR
ncbi:hypothetical protein K7432_015364 [Basidiobolus ranarum]|uniref:Uncharacterized protein n=1 Tax=Basidiobolus ranarum TaxID=34480 RepID=A0ABR2WG76_9FUNG